MGGPVIAAPSALWHGFCPDALTTGHVSGHGHRPEDAEQHRQDDSGLHHGTLTATHQRVSQDGMCRASGVCIACTLMAAKQIAIMAKTDPYALRQVLK
jgi:hypothetical protein